jgi:hypothetical protein
MNEELIAFLSARLDEEEISAQDVARGAPAPWSVGDSCVLDAGGTPVVLDEYHSHGGGFQYIARHDPARVLREVAAKRAIIERYERACAALESVVSFIRGQDDGFRQACMDAVRLLAAVYSDHPAYRPGWAISTPTSTSS